MIHYFSVLQFSSCSVCIVSGAYTKIWISQSFKWLWWKRLDVNQYLSFKLKYLLVNGISYLPIYNVLFLSKMHFVIQLTGVCLALLWHMACLRKMEGASSWRGANIWNSKPMSIRTWASIHMFTNKSCAYLIELSTCHMISMFHGYTIPVFR